MTEFSFLWWTKQVKLSVFISYELFVGCFSETSSGIPFQNNSIIQPRAEGEGFANLFKFHSVLEVLFKPELVILV